MRDVRESLVINGPEWMSDLLDRDASYATAESRMRLAIDLARHNVLRGTGGPFGAAVFETSTGRLLSAGVNSVVRLNNSVVHAEMLAIMLAEQHIGSYTLSGSSSATYEIVTSCDPCAMCLGAVLWSGLRRMVTGADRADATALSFDEGPVFPESYAYLEARGISITRGVLRQEAAAVLELYRRQGGPIYNA
jgi:tRNA(Arg) A34 adenosine deaminase TadA